MYDLLKKNKPLEWNKAAEASFEEFKAKLTSTTILSTADFVGSETLFSACYILSDESSIPFYSTSNGYEKYLPKI